MSRSIGPNIVKNGLILYFDAANTKSYPESGSLLRDLSGNENHNVFSYLSELPCSGVSFSGSGNGYNDTCSDSDPCSGLLTFQEALQHAHDQGGRLPTLDEVKNNVVKGTGCSYDYELIWTCNKGCDSSEHWVTAGDPTRTGDSYAGDDEIRKNTEKAYVRFVADIDLDRSDPVMLDDDFILNFLHDYGSNNDPIPTMPSYDSNNLGSLVFDGINNYLKVNQTIDINNSHSFCFWFKTTHNRDIDDEFFKNFMIDDYYLSIFIFKSSHINHGQIGFAYKNNSTTIWELNSSTLINNNNWYFFTGVINHSNKTSKIYLNGVEKDSCDITGDTYGTSIGEFHIGGYTNHIPANISNFMIYNKALSQDEIKQNYNTLKGRFAL